MGELKLDSCPHGWSQAAKEWRERALAAEALVAELKSEFKSRPPADYEEGAK